jgi:hypothetical protein
MQKEATMRVGEVKPGKSQKGSAQKHLNTGFVVAGLLMLLIYLVAQHFAVSAPHGNDPSIHTSPWSKVSCLQLAFSPQFFAHEVFDHQECC